MRPSVVPKPLTKDPNKLLDIIFVFNEIILKYKTIFCECQTKLALIKNPPIQII
jgi:hypothetical protein